MVGDTEELHAHRVVIGDANDNSGNGENSDSVTLLDMSGLLSLNVPDRFMSYLTTITKATMALLYAAAIAVRVSGGIPRRRKRKKTTTQSTGCSSSYDSGADDSEIGNCRGSVCSPLVNCLFSLLFSVPVKTKETEIEANSRWK